MFDNSDPAPIDELRRAVQVVLQRRLFPPRTCDDGWPAWCGRAALTLNAEELKAIIRADAGGLDGSHAINQIVFDARLRDARAEYQLANRTASEDHADILSELQREERRLKMAQRARRHG